MVNKVKDRGSFQGWDVFGWGKRNSGFALLKFAI